MNFQTYQIAGSGCNAHSFHHVEPIETRCHGNFVYDTGASVDNKFVKGKTATADSSIAAHNDASYAAAGLMNYQRSYHHGCYPTL